MSTKPPHSVAVQMLALTRFGGMTPRMFEPLFQRFGSLEGILGATEAELMSVSGIQKGASLRLSRAHQQIGEARALVESMAQREIRVLTRFDADYGELLAELNDPPPLLYLRGKMPSPAKKSVTLVGTHTASEDGIAVTTRVARLFAEAGVQVISSLTSGNDAAAHLGAHTGGGASFAVIDTGFDNISQAEGVPLAIDILRNGGVISEYPPEFKLGDETLEASDRLLVALGHAVVVTEVYQQSRRIRDIITFCAQIGKLSFLMIDPAIGPLADKESLEHAVRNGVIPMQGWDRLADIVRALV